MAPPKLNSIRIFLLAFLSWTLLLSISSARPSSPLEERAPKKLPLPENMPLMKPNYPPVDKTFFFSGFTFSEMSAVKKWAKGSGLVQVGDAWENVNFVQVNNYKNGKGKPDTDPAVIEFRDGFSFVFAAKAKGVAYIMIKGDSNAIAGRTFARAEFPQIQRTSAVSKFIRLSPDLLKKPGPVTEASGTEYWLKG